MCLTTYGQNTYVGKIIRMEDPACTSSIFPCLPCGGKVLGLETTVCNYVLNPTAHCMACFLIINDVVYVDGDEVKITGTESIKQIDDDPSKEYFELKIEAIEKIHEQNSYIGKITEIWNPLCMPPLPPCPSTESEVFALDISSCNFVLTLNSHLLIDRLIIEDIEYFIDDEVEITGSLTGKKDALTREYIELEIETIRKLPLSNNETLSSDNNKVYFDAKNQLIIIDETLQNQSLIFELTDLQGKIIFSTTITNNPISTAILPKGVYLYRLLQNKQAICFGKILKY